MRDLWTNLFRAFASRLLRADALPIALVLSVFALPGGVYGQPPGGGTTATDKSVKTEPAKKPLRGPKYLNLRYDEDFSYLDGAPDSYRSDLWDPIKDIHLDDNWRLSIGGEMRVRFESETNKSFGAIDPTSDSFVVHRWLLHADFKYRENFRIFAQGIAAFDEERNLPRRGIDENKWDLHQLFFDLKLSGGTNPLTVRAGRQELQYGNQRFVSPFDWGNIRRRFDGVKLFTKGPVWDVAAWWVQPVPVRRSRHDQNVEDFNFYGLYATYKGIKNHGLDLYFLAIDDDGVPRNANFKVGDRDIYTLGARFWGKTGAWDYETELAGQWGNWAGDTVQAWAWSINGGYTFKDCAYRPRLGAGFDLATGDDDPFYGKVGTFTQMFPLGHKYFGFLDLVGRQNINALNVNLTAWVVPKKIRAAAAFHSFWLNTKDDALYNAGGRPGRRDVTAHSGRDVGRELDLTVLCKVDAHSSVLLGYSHFWEQDFIVNTGSSEDADLFYIQYKYKF